MTLIRLPATEPDGMVLTVAIPVAADDLANPARHDQVVARVATKARLALDELHVKTVDEWNHEADHA